MMFGAVSTTDLPRRFTRSGTARTTKCLNILERAREISPALPRRIEHAQVLLAADVKRFAELDISASVQPIHATADWRKVDREWGQRGRLAYAFASLRTAGATLAFGSDTPVETMDPLAGVHAAVTRETGQGEPHGGWYPDERIPLADALRHYTSDPARAVREDTTVGRIAMGYAGDFVVLSRDPFTVEPTELHAVQVVLTGVRGEIVYESE